MRRKIGGLGRKGPEFISLEQLVDLVSAATPVGLGSDLFPIDGGEGIGNCGDKGELKDLFRPCSP